ncbi:S1/P1 nuclease [Tenacibaculum caenipelagi]|uniref:S1/P1 nuclease n=1 Tax=Tenacibaculum caenipelagi TaxID=1325435 RepID=A0A4R6TC07_9FLAO|nr:S1/P1 nuclease [Tenacibaculum caenipelagi]TDQ23914.1 S1/P1 nuclease [Tenacibaculum caenipelagi]
MRTKLLLLVSILFISVSFAANNEDIWGSTGHRATGKIAEKHLTKRAKKKIEKLLQGESLAFVSTYADEIKSDRKKYGKFYTWHYVNMPLDTRYEDTEKNPDGDLVTGIGECVKVLKDASSSVEDKRFYLKMLIHLIGDLHQPMHIGQKEDKGGNTIQVQWHGKGSNLHRVWDENLIDKYDMSYIELAENAKNLSKEQIKVIQKGSVIDWLQDTHQLTKEVYKSAEAGENLRYRYSYVYFPVVREQLQKGGLRLAKLLNEIFD